MPWHFVILYEFNIWNNIYDFMSALPACAAETAALLPTTDTPTADPTDWLTAIVTVSTMLTDVSPNMTTSPHMFRQHKYMRGTRVNARYAHTPSLILLNNTLFIISTTAPSGWGDSWMLRPQELSTSAPPACRDTSLTRTPLMTEWKLLCQIFSTNIFLPQVTVETNSTWIMLL